MKKNWLHIMTLVMCLVLLFVTVNQAKRIELLEQELDSGLRSLRDTLNLEVQKLEDNVRRDLEEANSVVSDYALEPTGLDPDSNALIADLSLELKQWHTDTTVSVQAVIDNAESWVTLDPQQSGVYLGELRIPLKTGTVVSLKAHISTDGMTRVEELGSWGDISMLLPLAATGSGWSGPNYVQGAMTTQFHISIGNPLGGEITVTDPEFRFYKNGTLVDTVAAVIDPNSYSSDGVCYTTDTEGNFYTLPCEKTDIIEIRFFCRDAFGLGYDFLFLTWSPENKYPDPLTGEGLILSWDE